MSQWRPHDRRIGARVPLGGAQLSWAPVLEATKRFRNKQRRGKAIVLDLSLGGASVRAPYDPRIMIGTRVHVAAGDGTGVAEIRRINTDDDPHEALYGIHFIHLDSALLQLINDTLTTRQPEQHPSGAT